MDPPPCGTAEPFNRPIGPLGGRGTWWDSRALQQARQATGPVGNPKQRHLRLSGLHGTAPCDAKSHCQAQRQDPLAGLVAHSAGCSSVKGKSAKYPGPQRSENAELPRRPARTLTEPRFANARRTQTPRLRRGSTIGLSAPRRTVGLGEAGRATGTRPSGPRGRADSAPGGGYGLTMVGPSGGDALPRRRSKVPLPRPMATSNTDPSPRALP
ncbi:hypothetical protein H8959_019555 [Pygathrix nigripes]